MVMLGYTPRVVHAGYTPPGYMAGYTPLGIHHPPVCSYRRPAPSSDTAAQSDETLGSRGRFTLDESLFLSLILQKC